MPIYDYVCSNCKHRIEVIHGINAEGPSVCPSCGMQGTMRRAMSTPAIHFKGSGWAKKDRSSTSGSSTKAAARSTASTGEGASGTPDTAGGSSSKAAESSGTSSASGSED